MKNEVQLNISMEWSGTGHVRQEVEEILRGYPSKIRQAAQTVANASSAQSNRASRASQSRRTTAFAAAADPRSTGIMRG